MKKHIFSRIFSFALVLCALTASAFAIEITLSDDRVSRTPLTSATATLPEWEVSGNYALYGWTNLENFTHYGWQMLPVPTESMTLEAFWLPMIKAKPGENAFVNGDFEDDRIYLRPSNGGARIVEEADGNRVLEYTRGSGYASLQVFVGWEAGRKYHIHYRVKTPADTSSIYNMIYGGNHLVQKPTKAGEWLTIDEDFTLPVGASEAADANNGWLSFYCNPFSGAANVVYYDDMTLIPYAKVRYHAGGGSGAPEDMSLLSGTVEILDVTPIRRGFVFGGWSLTEGGTTAVTSVEVNGSDIDLYAIWNPIGEQDAVTYQYATDYTGIADGTISIIAPEEAVSYTGVSLWFADENGVMEGYTPFAVMSLTEGAASYTASGNRIFAPGATRLSIHFTADGKDDIVYWYTIPEKRRHALETPLFTFYAVSDIHLQDYWGEMATNRTRMVNDVIANNPAFTIIAGDLVNHGTTEQFQRLDSFMKTNFNDAGRPAFITNGNHEFHINDRNSTEYDRDALMNSLASQLEVNRSMGYEIRRDGDSLWYSAIIEGRKFIFMSTPSTPAKEELASYVVSDAQLAFLEEELAAAETLGLPAFVVSHVPLDGYVPKGGSGITNTAAVEEILNRYPGTSMITAHTHSNLSLDRNYVLAGMTGGAVFTHLNDGCSVWLEEGTSKNGIYEVNFSAGQVIEVYADKMLVKARKFADPCLYFGHALYEVKLPGGDKMPKVDIDGQPADGAELIAVDENGNALSGDYTYEWLIDGKTYCTDAAYTIEATSNMAGKYVVLRVSDAEGNYSYARSKDSFTAVTVHYDANGGTGNVPSDERVFAGVSVSPNKDGASPKKDGYFFLGWSINKDDTQPMTEIYPYSDVTLYAVYSARPLFDFNASLCGWSPKSTIKKYEIKDSVLTYEDTGTDMYFTLSGISLSADEYRYMRIKRRYISGGGDGMFFGIKDGGGFSQTQRIPFTPETGKVVGEADGMQILEYDLQSIVGSTWKGTVNALRYDALAGAGVGETDYILFSKNHGIFSLNLAVDFPTYGVMPADDSGVRLDESTAETCTIQSIKWGKSDPESGFFRCEVTLVPKDGYEFSNDRDLVAGTTLPNSAILDFCEVLEDGTAVLTIITDSVIGVPAEGQTEAMLFEFSTEPYYMPLVVFAGYDADGRVQKVQVARYMTARSGRVWLFGMENCETVKAFAFDSAENLQVKDKAYSGVKQTIPQ